jgi:cytochrome b561
MTTVSAMNNQTEVAAVRRGRWRFVDSNHGYGWISIVLHWTGAVAVLTLWLVGSAIRNAKAGQVAELIDLHTSIAVSVYALLWLRIGWRLKVGHPEPLAAQRGIFFSVAQLTHVVLVLAIGAMLISGPLMAWSRGNSIHVWQVSIPSPWGSVPSLALVMRSVHVSMGWLVIWAIALHVAGTIKHTIFNRDGTLGRMLAPRQ